MQQKKNVRLLVLLLILASSTSAFYFFKSPDGRLEIDKNKFSVEDLSKIDKVILESPGGTIELKYNGTSWKVNDRYEADRQLITVLFATLEQAEPKRPVAADENSSVVDQITNEGVKVNLLEGSELKKTFISGGNSEKTVTYFYEPGDKPYVMTIPGYRIYVASILELDENGWKDKRVFNFNWRNFKSMNVTFPANSKEDFEIGQRDGFFNVGEGTADRNRRACRVDRRDESRQRRVDFQSGRAIVSSRFRQAHRRHQASAKQPRTYLRDSYSCNLPIDRSLRFAPGQCVLGARERKTAAHAPPPRYLAPFHESPSGTLPVKMALGQSRELALRYDPAAHERNSPRRHRYRCTFRREQVFD